MRRTRQRLSPNHALRLVAVGALGVAALGVPVAAASATVSNGQADTWQATAPPAIARAGATSTLLPGGDVLIAGGDTKIAELYDPATRSFTETGRMQAIRIDGTATLLPDGAVLLAGGRGPQGRQIASAELYHPGSANWSPTSTMSVARSGQTATLLPDGDVLVAGGGCNAGHVCDAGSFLASLSSAELYHPSTGTWSSAGRMHSGRQDGMAALLPNGNVLVAGGFSDCDDDFCEDTNSADLYNPTTGKWTSTGQLVSARERASMLVLGDGSVLLTGGTVLDPDTDVNHPLRLAELYDPSTGTWKATARMPVAHVGDSAALLPNGWVLVASGGTALSQVYQPDKGIWVDTGGTGAARRGQTVTALSDGDVLLTGGLDSAMVFAYGSSPLVRMSPASLAFGAQQVGSTSAARTVKIVNEGTADLNATGLTFGGPHGTDYRATTTCIGAPVVPGGSCTISVRFSPTRISERAATVGLEDDAPASPQHASLTGFGNGPGAWAPSGDTGAQREGAASVLLRDGQVLVAGGYSFAGYQSQAARYDPATRRFTPTGSMLMPLADISATLLTNGDVLVAGGYGTSGPTATAELYDPSTGVWSYTGSMLAAGDSLDETQLADGAVLVTGFVGTRSELYDVDNGTFASTGPMIEDAQLSAASLLPNGDVLVAGGVLNEDTGSQVYDPAADQWSATGSLHSGRQNPQAVLLDNGEVLVAGGVSPNGVPWTSSEVFDPTTDQYTTSVNPMSRGRAGFTLTLLPGGDVLAAGGCSMTCDGTTSATTDLYLPQYNDWTPSGTMTVPRRDATATLMRDGEVLMIGGTDGGSTIYSSSETYSVPALAGHPDSGPVGTQVRIHGQGFYAFEKVQIRFDNAALGSARTGPGGGFVATVTIPSSGVGRHTIRAQGRTSFGQAMFEFEVTS